VAGAAVHVEENDAGGLGIEVGILGGQRVDELRLAIGGDGLAGQEVIIEQSRECQAGETGSGLPEKLAAGPPAKTVVLAGRLSHGVRWIRETGE